MGLYKFDQATIFVLYIGKPSSGLSHIEGVRAVNRKRVSFFFAFFFKQVHSPDIETQMDVECNGDEQGKRLNIERNDVIIDLL